MDVAEACGTTTPFYQSGGQEEVDDLMGNQVQVLRQCPLNQLSVYDGPDVCIGVKGPPEPYSG